MISTGLKIVRFTRDRQSYPFETQVLAVVLYNYALLGLISYITLFFIQIYSYAWPLWLLIVFGSLFLMEVTLRIKNIEIIRRITLIISIFVLSPLGLYFSGSITTPSSFYILVILINSCILSSRKERFFYFLALMTITLSFIIIENFFPSFLLFPSPSEEVNLKLWSFIYIGAFWVVFRQISGIVNVLSKYRQLLNQSNKDLYNESIIDGLTNVFNKKYLIQTLDYALLGLRRKNSSIGVLLIDIDNFKAYNDHYGHMEGDVCLKEVAKIINMNLLREEDKVFRFGGEEFVIVLESVDLEGAIVMAKKIIDSLRQRKIPHEYSSAESYVTVSIGISVFSHPDENLNRDDLLKFPDEAMYEAKKNGKNQYKVINPN